MEKKSTFSLQTYLNRFDLHIVETLKKNFIRKEINLPIQSTTNAQRSEIRYVELNKVTLFDGMTEWRNNRMVQWENGGVGEWWNGGMVVWENGGMGEWWNGRMVEWANGGIGEWVNGGMGKCENGGM